MLDLVLISIKEKTLNHKEVKVTSAWLSPRMKLKLESGVKTAFMKHELAQLLGLSMKLQLKKLKCVKWQKQQRD